MLWSLTGILCLFGMIMVVSTTAGSGSADATNYSYITRQALACVIGICGALCITYFGTERLRHPAFITMLIVGILGLLLAVQIIGTEINGARRWISLGPINVQPSELAKLALIIILAWQLHNVAEKVRLHWNGVLMPSLFFCIAAALVYMTRDLGSVLVMAGVLWCMLFFARARWLYMTIIALGTLPLVAYYAVFDTFYRYQRINAFVNPWDDTNPATFHLQQSLIGIGSGGMHGVGLGQAATFLPEDHTDFIFARICQECGLIGAMVLVTVYFLFVIAGLSIANYSRDRHQRLLAVGATILIGIQAFWNMMVATGLVPTKGLTLPFVSYGGTSMVVCLLAVGVLDAVIRRPVRVLENSVATGTRLGAMTTKVVRKRKKAATAGSM